MNCMNIDSPRIASSVRTSKLPVHATHSLVGEVQNFCLCVFLAHAQDFEIVHNCLRSAGQRKFEMAIITSGSDGIS